jgi:hypothetical protein
MGRFSFLILSFALGALPPFAGGRDAVAVVVVGGVDAAPEPEGSSESESENPAVKMPPLSAGDAILKDLDLDPRGGAFDRKMASLFLDRAQLERVMQQMIDLDAEDFRKRNEASKALAMVEAPVEHLLGAARRESSAEMSRRIQGILNVRIKKRRLDALYHVAGKLAREETPGWVTRLGVMASTFDSIAHWDLLRMFEIAAAKSSREQDREVLDKALTAKQEALRELAAFVIGFRFSGDPVVSESADAIGDDDLLKLANARGRVAAGDRRVTAALLDLLASKSLRVRHEAGLLLRGTCGKDFGFAGYDPAERQVKAIGRWQNFIGSLARDRQVEPMLLGRGFRGEFMVLVGKPPGKEGTVIPWTTSGRKMSGLKIAASMAAIRPDHISFDAATGFIVASGGGHEDGRVSVITNDGTELWSASGIPMDGGTAIMPGGRLLVAIGREVEELDLRGDRVGVWQLPSRAVFFHRLREGRYLCAHPDGGSLAEYGTGGELLWQVDGFNHPSWVERLQNGNLLVVVVADKPKEGSEQQARGGNMEVIETSPDGKVIISRIHPRGVNVISSAARLPNGNTLVGTEKGLAEYTPAGYAVKVWLKTVISSIHVR